MPQFRSVRALTAIGLVSALTLISGRCEAQDIRESGIDYAGGPWNSRRFIAGDALVIPHEPSPEILSAFPNIAVTTSSRFQTECSIAINPRDSLNMIVEEIDGDFSATNGVFYTVDGGLSWHVGSIGGEANYFGDGDPWVAFDANGVAYVTGLQSTPQSKIRTLLERSVDKGNTWAIFAHPFDGGAINDTLADEPVIAIDMNATSPHLGAIYSLSASDATIPLFGTAPIGIKSSAILPNSPPQLGWTSVSPSGLAQIPHLTVGPTGKLYATYLMVTDISTIKGGLWLSTSTNAGTSWSAPTLIRASQYTDTVNGFPKVGFPAASRIGPTPRIAIDTSKGSRRGWLYVSYAMPTSANGKSDLDVFCQHSTDDGATWSQPVRVNDDPIAPTKDQLTPAMCINPDGIIGIAFYDRRDDPNNFLLQTYIAISDDGGMTWKNMRVSSASTDPIAARRQTGLAVADYISIAATRSAFFPLWTDGRSNNGDLNTYIAQVPISTSSVSANEQSQFTLTCNPNPARSIAALNFRVPVFQTWHLRTLDILGREVREAKSGVGPGGFQSLTLSLEKLPEGAYLIQLESAGVLRSEHLIHFR